MQSKKKKAIRLNVEDLTGSVEAVRDSVTGRRKATLRTMRLVLPDPAPVVTRKQVERIRIRLNVSQQVFAGMLNLPKVTVVSWEKGSRKPSGTALRLLQIIEKHPEVLDAA